MKGTVLIPVMAPGHNSFAKTCISPKASGLAVVSTTYYPHGVLEMLAFVLSGTFSLFCFDAVRKRLSTAGDSPSLHSGDISLFVFNRVGNVFTGIALLLAPAAATECWVTLFMIKSALETPMQDVQK